ncbi:MAG: beta-ketoacyl-[acyl-carrier-protein] synthase II [Clostridiales bacterium]|nr:MAG: beta-ketoacyl-[acyl-carrier-protein] synthase II [Clostridiales bacterium]
MNHNNRVVVTGIGIVSPIGNDLETVVDNLKNGFNGVSEIELFDTTDFTVKIAAECKNYQASDHFTRKEERRMDRSNQFAIVAARKAREDAKLEIPQTTRVGCIMSSGIGGLNTIDSEIAQAQTRGYDRMSPFFISKSIANMSSGQIAIDLGIHGYVSSSVTACASGSNAIMDAYDLIRSGRQDIVFAGGCEASINPSGIGGFTSMKALSDSNNINRASIPFDSDRSGFVMGEGAACLVLENYEMAVKRGAKIYGEIVAAEMTCDGYHITHPCVDGKYQIEVMKQALNTAGIKPAELDYINAHGTSTVLNDQIETHSIKSVLGENNKNVAISSTKSMTGHLLGAAGAIESAICLLAIKHNFIPPTINLEQIETSIDLNIVANQMQTKKVNYALNNSFGFGGHNVAIIFKGLNHEI